MPELPIQFALEPIALPRHQMIAFAERFDPQPFHLDEAAAAGTLLGGLSASAWYVCAKISDALRAELVRRRLKAEIAGAEQIILFSPIRADDVISASVRVEPLKACDCGGSGTAVSVDVVRSSGDCVARMALNFVMDDIASMAPEGATCCSFREGRKARHAVRHRIHDIPFFEQIEIGDEIDRDRGVSNPNLRSWRGPAQRLAVSVCPSLACTGRLDAMHGQALRRNDRKAQGEDGALPPSRARGWLQAVAMATPYSIR
jgi:acyl dehydratase